VYILWFVPSQAKNIPDKKYPEFVSSRISKRTMQALQEDADRKRWSVSQTIRIILESIYHKPRSANGK